MDLTNELILIAALAFLVSILASLVGQRLGMPVLLVFLIIGMLLGEEGPGDIHFDDVQVTHLVGSLALAIILFDGGMATSAQSFRVGLKPALGLATLGVLLTSALTGLFADPTPRPEPAGGVYSSPPSSAPPTPPRSFPCCAPGAWSSRSGSRPPWRSSPAATTPWRSSSPWS